MSPHTTALLLLTLWTSLEEGLSGPAGQRPTEPAGPVSHHRTRRCSCNSRLDSECHYFCHLDIIWVNTQSKTTLYGLGGSRRRRAAGRCSCGSPSDRTCSRFCDHSFNIHPPEGSRSPRPPAHLLRVLRDVAKGPRVQGAVNLEVETAFDPSETKMG